MTEANAEFAYRLNAYKLTKNLQGAVTQAQVNELRRRLASEAREVHGVKHETSKKAQTANPPADKLPTGGG